MHSPSLNELRCVFNEFERAKVNSEVQAFFNAFIIAVIDDGQKIKF